MECISRDTHNRQIAIANRSTCNKLKVAKSMSYSSHVAVFAFPFGTHAAPLLSLVQGLAACTPAVRFTFFNIESSNAKIFTDNNHFDNVKAYAVSDGIPEGHVISGNVIREGANFFLGATPGNFKKGVQEAEAEAGVKFGCLLTDAWFWFAGEMAEEMGVPWVPFWTAGAPALSVHVHTDLICSMVGPTAGTNSEEHIKLIPGLSAVRIGDLPMELLLGKERLPIGIILYKMALNLHKATAVVLNSFEELDSIVTNDLRSKLRMKVLNIGPWNLLFPPPPKSDENGCIVWLDKQKAASVVYMSFGTIITTPPNELLACAEVLEAKGIPFIWSVRDNDRSKLPEGFIERASCTIGKIVSWAPQLQVLAHPSVGAFVTHCGWNSILESISYGVPTICRPFMGDQLVNSRMVEDVWQIGVKVEGGIFTKSGLMNALDFVFSDEKGKKLRENIGVLRRQALKAVESSGSSTEDFNTLKDIFTSIKGA